MERRSIDVSMLLLSAFRGIFDAEKLQSITPTLLKDVEKDDQCSTCANSGEIELHHVDIRNRKLIAIPDATMEPRSKKETSKKQLRLVLVDK